MGELTIEEKAGRYDEALKRAKEWFNIEEPDSYTCIVGSIFPELKESEFANRDEKIRKAIIEGLREMKNSFHTISSIKIDDAIAWLEKPGEQKTANKIEPKFKVGDWVVQENNEVYKVVKVCKSWYEVANNKDCSIGFISFDKECICHLWTIADAKDGDVLICPKYANDIIPNIFIFKNIKTKDNDVFCYCSFLKTFMTGGYVANADPINTDFYPATKEQRDTLMKAMADAGYTFDFEKKELKKIIDEKQIKKNLQDNSFRRMFEESHAWSKEDCNKISSIKYLLHELDNHNFDSWFDSLKYKLQYNKPVCDEDNENYINDLIKYFSQNERLKNTKEDIVIWLKSLKSQKQWKPSDAQMASITCAVRKMKESACYDSELVSLLNDLKKLREE